MKSQAFSQVIHRWLVGKKLNQRKKATFINLYCQIWDNCLSSRESKATFLIALLLYFVICCQTRKKIRFLLASHINLSWTMRQCEMRKERYAEFLSCTKALTYLLLMLKQRDNWWPPCIFRAWGFKSGSRRLAPFSAATAIQSAKWFCDFIHLKN